MFDVKIEEVNYYYDSKCEGESPGDLPKVKAEILIRDENNFMSPVMKRTWVFDVLSYANKDTGVGAIELIIEELVKKIWTELHSPKPKERAVRIDMYLPLHTCSFDHSYMNELITKYLNNERARDRYARLLSNSRFDKVCLEYREEKAKQKIKEYEKMKIENVIFNDPATIVFWRDGSKTVVKAQDGEPFDQEKGLAMAIAKKAYGNEGNYYNEFKKFIKDEPIAKVSSIEAVLDYLEPKEDNKNE